MCRFFQSETEASVGRFEDLGATTRSVTTGIFVTVAKATAGEPSEGTAAEVDALLVSLKAFLRAACSFKMWSRSLGTSWGKPH